MTRQTWEEERDARILARVLVLLESMNATLNEVLKRLPPPPTYLPTTAIVMIVDPVAARK
jgi:hypothetical protein